MSEPKFIGPDEALEAGVHGTLHDTIENEAYTVQGQGPETAKREREQLHELRASARERSASDDDESASKSSKRKSSTSSSSSSSSSSGSSGS